MRFTRGKLFLAIAMLALVFVLGFAREAAAIEVAKNDQRVYSFHIGKYRFGFVEWVDEGTSQPTATLLSLGPFGNRISPFTVAQGRVGFCLIVAMLIIVPAVLAARWKRRAPR
jgi:hypothetical protein